MCAKQLLKDSGPREPTLQEEIATLGDDDLMDFMNLTSLLTGV